MPKMKTNRGANKRFNLTKNGKIKRAKGQTSHLLERKSPKRKRHLRGTAVAAEADSKRIKRMLPYA